MIKLKDWKPVMLTTLMVLAFALLSMDSVFGQSPGDSLLSPVICIEAFGAIFSHGICPECMGRLYPDFGEG